MKKLITLLAWGLLTGIFHSTIEAQTKVSKVNEGIGAGYDFNSIPVRANAVLAARNLEKVNRKAIRQFTGWYKDTRDENWFHVSTGIVVKFEENGLQKMAAFDTKGHWLFTIIYFSEFSLPARIRWLVKSRFYDYRIAEIEQIESPSSNIYIVHLEKDGTWLNLRIHDEEIRVMEDFPKQ